MRHWDAVRNVTLPGDRVAFHLGGAHVGWVRRVEVPRLRLRGAVERGDAVVLEDPASLADMAASLAETGAFPWRGEAFDVRAVPDGLVLATVDRGALPWFGIGAQGVHVNGLVLRQGGVHVWVARRAAARPVDPGKLDHLVAGGIPAGMTARETLLKEAAEEAGLPRELVQSAQPTGMISYITERPEGLRRDRLHCYDLWLPDGLQPVPRDGEVESFELWPLPAVMETLASTDRFKFNVALVVIDLIERLERKKEILF